MKSASFLVLGSMLAFSQISLAAPQCSVFFNKTVLPEFDRSQGYKVMGANVTAKGTNFGIWAPNARNIEVMVEADDWKTHQLTKDDAKGIWFGEVTGVGKGDKLKYKYKITDASGNIQFRNDPYARAIVPDEKGNWDSLIENKKYNWQIQNFIPSKKLRLMEVNPRTRVPNNPNVNFKDLAHHLIPVLKESGINTVSMMPITHHNVVESWGYQPGGIFAVNFRHGTPSDLKYFVDYMHKNGVTVVFDVVLGHASKDWNTGLGGLDGTQLYFSDKSYLGEHRDWGTYIYDLNRQEVRDFLLSNVKFWAEEYKIDGIRVDGVTSMLYLDYSRGQEEKELIWKEFGTNKNVHAVEFLKTMNREIKKVHPNFITIAEESSGWQGVTHSVESGGLGFDYMWGMGGMHHMRQFLKDSPENRDLNKILAPNEWKENYIHYVNSHDETAHGKKRYIEEISGASGTKKKFDVARLVTMWMYTMRGRPMIFQGDEIAEVRGWNHNLEVQEVLKKYWEHSDFEKFISDLGKLNESEKAFERIDYDSLKVLNVDNKNKVLTFARFGEKAEDTLIVVLYFGTQTLKDYTIPAPHFGNWEIAFNSDAGFYGGQSVIVKTETHNDVGMNLFPSSVKIENLSAYSGLILKNKN